MILISSKKCENCNHIRIIADGPYIVSSDIPLNEYAIMGRLMQKIKRFMAIQ
ncbi:hypothetical protein [endosymbiont 'TC1' of Trimyema compressum]|uniref:hypothetical protein n=1 Tax=endosymbiont 'TC1' of Trimyema compressum TaxID=243899 RepID=UPI001392311D|nr:hypothetical protein [endosymbiont 'TC1' of Trimyema compressum]